MEIIPNRSELVENYINNIDSEPNPTILYHFTKPTALRGIYIQNRLIAMDRYQVSFTADKDYYKKEFQYDDNKLKAVIVIDAQKLSNDYVIKRFVDDTYPEEQEWVVEKTITNIKDYILYIGNIDIDDYYVYQLNKLDPNIQIKPFN